MKNLVLMMGFLISSSAMSMHYTIDRDGTIRDTGRGEKGCVLGDTLVYLEDGRRVAISKVAGSDRDRSFIQRVSGFEKKQVMRLVTDSGKSITATLNHPFYRKDLLYKASEFKIGDEIDTIDGAEKISQIEYFFTSEKVYNVILGDRTEYKRSENLDTFLRAYPFQNLSASEHKLVLNGFISGDLTIQKVGQ